MLARDKHSSLLRKSVNYGQKQFYNIDTRAETKKDHFKGAMIDYLTAHIHVLIVTYQKVP